jgi:hypothetical protein
MTNLPPMPAILASFVPPRLVNCFESASDATLTDAGRCPNPTPYSINPNEVHLPRGPAARVTMISTDELLGECVFESTQPRRQVGAERS